MSSETQSVLAMILVSFLLVVLLVIVGVALLLAEPEEAAAAAATIPVSPLKPTPAGGASPTFHVLSTLPPSPTPTNTPEPTDTPAPTNTPEPTSVPPTNTPQPVQQQPAQQQPAAEPPPPEPPAGPIVSSKGLQTDHFNVDKTEFAVNEQIWFNFRLLNPTSNAVSFGFLGVSVSQDGQNLGDLFHTSYQEHTIKPLDGTFADYRDWTLIDRPGTFQLHLTICYPDIATCSNGGQWENISNPITVTVR